MAFWSVSAFEMSIDTSETDSVGRPALMPPRPMSSGIHAVEGLGTLLVTA